MSEVETDDSSRNKELNESDKNKQMNIKNESHEETDNHKCTEGIANTEFPIIATETENLNIKIEEVKEQVVANHEVTGAFATGGVDVKCEYTDVAKNVFDQKLLIDNEGVDKIKSKVDKSGNSCEVTTGVHWRLVTHVPCKELNFTLGDVRLTDNTPHCYKQLMNNAPTTEYNPNIIHHFPIKRGTLFADKNIFGSISNDGNIGENLNMIGPGKTSHTVNTRRNELVSHYKKQELGLEDIMSTSSKHNTQNALQLTAQSSRDNRTVCHATIKDKNIFMDPEKISNIAGVSTGTVDGSISITRKSFICNMCDKKFSIKKYLNQHIRKHLDPYRCTYCSYNTIYKRYLENHINCVHTRSTHFICDYCGYVSYSKYNLKVHIENKHFKRVPYNCTYCSYVTYSKPKLSDHINAQHTNTTVFKCSYCNFKTYRKSKLKHHTNVLHSKRNVYNCSLCSYKTCEKWNYSRHVNAKHTKTDIFSCSFCNYKAKYKITLTKHINVKHTKTSVYYCSHCDYKTYDDYCLRTHVNVKHTKTNVYNCPHCSYKAYDKSTLSKHVKVKHIKTVFNCSHCTFETYYQSSLSRHIELLHSNKLIN